MAAAIAILGPSGDKGKVSNDANILSEACLHGQQSKVDDEKSSTYISKRYTWMYPNGTLFTSSLHGLSKALKRTFVLLQWIREPISATLALATFIIAVTGLVYYSYRSDQLARWTAAKDFLQQCQNIQVNFFFRYRHGKR